MVEDRVVVGLRDGELSVEVGPYISSGTLILTHAGCHSFTNSVTKCVNT